MFHTIYSTANFVQIARNYKMYLPPLSPEEEYISTWEYRRSLLQDRIGLVDADIVCIQEVSPLSFEEDFSFMSDILGYDGVELFRKVCILL
jgi:mRNA deadenylase 3'-5' endonuclease subunit Ccr4